MSIENITEMSYKIKLSKNEKLDSFIKEFEIKATDNNTYMSYLIQYYSTIIKYDKLKNYFCNRSIENMSMVAIQLQDTNMLTHLKTSYNYTPYKKSMKHITLALKNKLFKSVKFLIQNDSLLYRRHHDNIFLHDLDILLKNKKTNIIKLIFQNYKNKPDFIIILQRFLYCSDLTIDILRSIIFDYNYLLQVSSQDIIRLIYNNYNKLDFIITISNALLQQKIPIPDLHIGYDTRFNKDTKFPLNDSDKYMLNFGYYDNYLINYYNIQKEQNNNNDVDFNSLIYYMNLTSEEYFINFCLKKGFIQNDINLHTVLFQLLKNNQYTYFQELYSTYDIPVNVTNYILYKLLDKYMYRKISQETFMNLIEFIVKNSKKPINFNIQSHVYSDYYLVELIRKNNLPIIKLLVNYGADININNNHPLRRAIYKDPEILQYLLDNPNIITDKTHFTKRQYNYLHYNNKLNPYLISLFQKYNPKVIIQKDNQQELLLACAIGNNSEIKRLLYDGCDILSLGSLDFVFNHPIYKENEYLLVEYARKYFALKKIKRIIFGRRGIVHNIKYKLGRKRVFAEFDDLENQLSKKMKY